MSRPQRFVFDMTERIEAQIERFVPGFRGRILAKSMMGPTDLQRTNANLVDGDINGGIMDFRQLFTRPVARLTPYSTLAKWLYFAPPRHHLVVVCKVCAATSPPAPPYLT